jgi:hypothetical protein
LELDGITDSGDNLIWDELQNTALTENDNMIGGLHHRDTENEKRADDRFHYERVRRWRMA